MPISCISQGFRSEAAQKGGDTIDSGFRIPDSRFDAIWSVGIWDQKSMILYSMSALRIIAAVLMVG
jgi:hypothetical protein